MKVVILAAGKGTRMKPFSLRTQKVLMPVLGKPFLFYTIDDIIRHNIAKEKDIIVVTKSREVEQKILDRYPMINIVEQVPLYGTAAAVYSAIGEAGNDDILLINGDVYAPGEDIKKLLNYNNAIMSFRVEDPTKYGVFELDSKGRIVNWVEKSSNPPSNLINAGIYKFEKDFWTYVDGIIKNNIISPRGEYELTDVINNMIKDKYEIYSVEANYWLHLSYPWDLFEIEEYFFNKLYKEIFANYDILGYIKVGEVFIKDDSEVGANVVFNGKGIINSSVVKDFTYLEGKFYINKSEVGPFTHLRGYVSLHGSNKVGSHVTLKNTILWENSKVPHNNYIGDSIIGRNVNFGAGSIVANLRHDDNTVKVIINEKLVDTKRRKFGTLIADNVKIGVNTVLSPGTVVYPNCQIPQGSVVRGTIMCKKTFEG